MSDFEEVDFFIYSGVGWGQSKVDELYSLAKEFGIDLDESTNEIDLGDRGGIVHETQYYSDGIVIVRDDDEDDQARIIISNEQGQDFWQVLVDDEFFRGDGELFMKTVERMSYRELLESMREPSPKKILAEKSGTHIHEKPIIKHFYELGRNLKNSSNKYQTAHPYFAPLMAYACVSAREISTEKFLVLTCQEILDYGYVPPEDTKRAARIMKKEIQSKFSDFKNGPELKNDYEEYDLEISLARLIGEGEEGRRKLTRWIKDFGLTKRGKEK